MAAVVCAATSLNIQSYDVAIAADGVDSKERRSAS